MKMHQIMFGFILCIFSLETYAHWQVSRPGSLVPREPFFETRKQSRTVSYEPRVRRPVYSSVAFHPQHHPKHHARRQAQYQHVRFSHPSPVFVVSISGSLKENFERIMSRYRWKVIWKAPYDYNFYGTVTGTSFPNMIQKLLDPFPLQGIMYMSNRTVAVTTRNKIGTK